MKKQVQVFKSRKNATKLVVINNENIAYFSPTLNFVVGQKMSLAEFLDCKDYLFALAGNTQQDLTLSKQKLQVFIDKLAYESELQLIDCQNATDITVVREVQGIIQMAQDALHLNDFEAVKYALTSTSELKQAFQRANLDCLSEVTEMTKFLKSVKNKINGKSK